MSQISLGNVKAWELNSAGTLGICIPKIAEQNLHISKNTSFKVIMDVQARTITFEPIPAKSKARGRETNPRRE